MLDKLQHLQFSLTHVHPAQSLFCQTRKDKSMAAGIGARKLLAVIIECLCDSLLPGALDDSHGLRPGHVDYLLFGAFDDFFHSLWPGHVDWHGHVDNLVCDALNDIF